VANYKKIPTADTYDWSSGRHREIRNNLDGLQIEIAELIQIDPLEKQLVRVPRAPDTSIGNSASAYIEHGKKPGVTDTVLRIQLVLDELEGVLCRFVVNSHNLNGQASDPTVRKALEIIAARDQITGPEIEELELTIRELIAKHYPGKPEAFRKGRFKSRLVSEAARRALADVPPSMRGRPQGTTNEAAKQLVHELGGIYGAYSPERPSRSVVNKKIGAVIVGRTEEGRFKLFCEQVIRALPEGYQDQVTNSGGGLATLVRKELSGS
jgi:hypothetical protein